MTIDDFCKTLEERTNWIYNNLKAFQYIRLNGLQGGKDEIGGGNISMATLLFIMISVYAKALYFINNSHTFNATTGQTNETDAFKLLFRGLKSSGVITDLPDDDTSLDMIWRGFRHRLVHRFTVENGKSAATFIYPESNHGFSVSQIMVALDSEQIFQDDDNGRNWVVNCDALHAKLPDIYKYVCDTLKMNPDIDVLKLEEYIG
jgi:hypothetical protein